MSLTVLLTIELVGLVGLFALIRSADKRKAAGKPPRPRLIRLATGLLGLALLVCVPAVMVARVAAPGLQPERQQERLIETGTPATATIIAIEETGTIVNSRPKVEVLLHVQPPDRPAFHSQWTWVFSVADAQTYRVGSKVKVFYDPEDLGAVTVVGLASPGNVMVSPPPAQ